MLHIPTADLFVGPEAQAAIDEAGTLTADIDLQLLWDCAPDEEFGLVDVAHEYFGSQASIPQQVALAIALQGAPVFFRRKGRGRFQRAPLEQLQAGLAALERKQKELEQQSVWQQELVEGTFPETLKSSAKQLLFSPDKNTSAYKALIAACTETGESPAQLMIRCGAIDSPLAYHQGLFLKAHFPNGADHNPAVGVDQAAYASAIAELSVAQVQAFSIDDSGTTEIDDALSVTPIEGGHRIGIHIAAPGLALSPGSAIDQLGRARLSTVYMPGYKITMLPDSVVQAYTLIEGRDCPAVSLYVSFSEDTLEVQSAVTRLERVPILVNLRHDQLDERITREWLEGEDQSDHADVPVSRATLAFYWRLAQTLKARREVVRGKPENFNRPDYSFKLERGNNDTPPTGDETVLIGTRKRGAPLDLMVAEAMILANSTWGQWMASLGVPGIYRSQASLAPGVKVRMGTKALPHAGIGVPSYAWSTSPLRRYTDLVNQWQIIACAKHGATAALAAPFKPKDAELFSIISGFEAAYSAYNSVQSSMERYWTLRHVQQHGIEELDASLVKEMGGGIWLVRADALPLMFSVMGAHNLPRGARVRVKLADVDLMALDVRGTVIAHLDAEDPGAGAEEAEQEAEDEDNLPAGPVTIAVDLNDSTPLHAP